ncbi:hypothetical protein GJAV_G00075080 [Gymnothorax javanicus]|nr:hypothetical protein GJAV_G00075080 [Gymnothorax javanicus]
MQLIQTPEQKQRAKVRTKSRRSRSGQLKVPRLLKNSSYPQIPKPSKESPSWPENLGISTSHISLPLINISAQSVVTSVPRPTKALETVRFPRILKKKRNSPVHGSKMSDCQAPSYKLPDVSIYRTKQLLQRFKTQVRDQQRDKDRETDCEIGVPEYPDNLLLAATLQSLREQLIHLKGFDTKEKQGGSRSHPPLCQKMDTAKTERKMHRSFQPPYGTEQPVILSLHKRNLSILLQIKSNVKIM